MPSAEATGSSAKRRTSSHSSSSNKGDSLAAVWFQWFHVQADRRAHTHRQTTSVWYSLTMSTIFVVGSVTRALHLVAVRAERATCGTQVECLGVRRDCKVAERGFQSGSCQSTHSSSGTGNLNGFRALQSLVCCIQQVRLLKGENVLARRI